VIFDRAELDVVLIICHFANLSVLRNFTIGTQSHSPGIERVIRRLFGLTQISDRTGNLRHETRPKR
jgi:hypothetical protein